MFVPCREINATPFLHTPNGVTELQSELPPSFRHGRLRRQKSGQLIARPQDIEGKRLFHRSPHKRLRRGAHGRRSRHAVPDLHRSDQIVRHARLKPGEQRLWQITSIAGSRSSRQISALI